MRPSLSSSRTERSACSLMLRPHCGGRAPSPLALAVFPPQPSQWARTAGAGTPLDFRSGPSYLFLGVGPRSSRSTTPDTFWCSKTHGGAARIAPNPRSMCRSGASIWAWPTTSSAWTLCSLVACERVISARSLCGDDREGGTCPSGG